MLIQTHNVNLAHDEDIVLRNVDFQIDRGEIVTIVGPNGSGKSTLVRALVGALRPGTGTIQRKPGLKIGYVPQKLALDQSMPMTVARFLGLPGRAAPTDTHDLLAKVGLSDLSQTQIAALSGGQLRRVMLARALRGRPDILVLDEPTSGMDQTATADFYRLIEQLRTETGTAVLLVSHDLHVVMSASDRVVCLNGHVCCEGQPEIVSSAPEYRALFGHGTGGTMALYRHDHDHSHDDQGGHAHD
jgi:zinc transport system ATP-binding protein